MKVKQQTNTCPPWCQFFAGNTEPHEHMSAPTIRASFYMELLRYNGDDVTYIGLMDHMDGGARISVPIDVLLELIGEARRLIAA